MHERLACILQTTRVVEPSVAKNMLKPRKASG